MSLVGVDFDMFANVETKKLPNKMKKFIFLPNKNDKAYPNFLCSTVTIACKLRRAVQDPP